MTDSWPLVAVGIGGTKIAAGSVDHGLRVTERRTAPCPATAGPDAVLSLAADLLGCTLGLLALLITTITSLAGSGWPLAVLAAYAAGAGLGRITFGTGPVDPTPPPARPRRAAD